MWRIDSSQTLAQQRLTIDDRGIRIRCQRLRQIMSKPQDTVQNLGPDSIDVYPAQQKRFQRNAGPVELSGSLQWHCHCHTMTRSGNRTCGWTAVGCVVLQGVEKPLAKQS